ncbi:MAG: biotin transporter BioY [Chlorobi bacterium]|nr:biotin transporter BioY [Chlorobiota bacterium]
MKEKAKAIQKPLSVSLLEVKNSQLFWVISFSILTFFAAQVLVPVQPVPFTLQTMLVLLSGAFLGARNGAYSQVLYVAGGFVGLPVFAGFAFGPAVIFGPTGGYLLAFPLAAFLVGFILEKNKSVLAVIASMILGTVVILVTGALYLSLFMNHNFKEAFFAGAAIFSIWGLIKVAAASSVYLSLKNKYPKLP